LFTGDSSSSIVTRRPLRTSRTSTKELLDLVRHRDVDLKDGDGGRRRLGGQRCRFLTLHDRDVRTPDEDKVFGLQDVGTSLQRDVVPGRHQGCECAGERCEKPVMDVRA
jgi:hypothetical protein